MADRVELKSDPTPNPGAAPENTKSEQDGKVTKAAASPPGKPTEPEKGSERPAWLPAEFKTVEEFGADYAKKAAAKAVPPATPSADSKSAKEAVEKAGLDMAALNSEFAIAGRLSDESIAKLEKAGIKKEQVDAYVSGVQAQQAQYRQALSESVGGAEELTAVLKWAESLPKAEIEAANAVLESGNAAQAKLLLEGLNARRQASEGREFSPIRGRSAAITPSISPYESTAQWQKDVRSREYKNDPAFREKVMKRLAASAI